MVGNRKHLVVAPVAMVPVIGCFVVHPVHDGYRRVFGLLEHDPHGRTGGVAVDFFQVHDPRRAVNPRGLAVVEFKVLRGASIGQDDHTFAGDVIVQSFAVGLHVDIIGAGRQHQGVLALIVGDGQVVGAQGRHDRLLQGNHRVTGRIEQRRVVLWSAVGDRYRSREGPGVGHGAARAQAEINRGHLALLHHHVGLHLRLVTAEHGQHRVGAFIDAQYFVRSVGGCDTHPLAAQFLDLDDDTGCRFIIPGGNHTGDTGGHHDHRVQYFHLVGFNHHVVDSDMVVAHPFAQVAEPDGPGAGGDTVNLIVALAVGHGDVLGAHHRHQYARVADVLAGLGGTINHTLQAAGGRRIRVHRHLVELGDLCR